MDRGRTFPPRRMSVITQSGDTGTKWERLCGWPSNPVGVSREGNARGGFGRTESCRVDWLEKPEGEFVWRPYRKPTQVGKASSLR